MARQLEDAVRLVKEVQYPVVLVKAADFVALGSLPSHEDARDRGILRFLDTVADTHKFLDPSTRRFGVFFSHQWTSFDHPDHTGMQYSNMCEAIFTIQREFSQSLESMYVRVDYMSIPQRSVHGQRCAINSLPIYASLLHAFVIIAPPTPHKNIPGMTCDEASYQRRGWCRAEQLCHVARRGAGNMFLAEDQACSSRRQSELERPSMADAIGIASSETMEVNSQLFFFFGISQ